MDAVGFRTDFLLLSVFISGLCKKNTWHVIIKQLLQYFKKAKTNGFLLFEREGPNVWKTDSHDTQA